MKRTDRREVLETAAGIAATGALAGLAGCLSDTAATATPGDDGEAPATATPTAAPGTRTSTAIRASASVQADDWKAVITVTWGAEGNADHLTASFQPDGADAVEKRIDRVGHSITYDAADGATVQVTVVAHAGDRSSVILDETAWL